MKPLIKNVLAIIAGWLSGSVINMVLIQVGHYLIPIEGVDPNDMEALMAVMPTLDAEYFIFPFLAHALGTLIGVTIAGLIAATHKMKISLCIGGLFLLRRNCRQLYGGRTNLVRSLRHPCSLYSHGMARLEIIQEDIKKHSINSTKQKTYSLQQIIDIKTNVNSKHWHKLIISECIKLKNYSKRRWNTKP